MEPLLIPESLSFSSFVLELYIRDIYYKIENILNNMNHISYDYNHSKYEWSCIYLNKSIGCKFRISIFINIGFDSITNSFIKKNNSHVLEFEKISGDGFYFFYFYKRIKEIFLNIIHPISSHNFRKSIDDTEEKSVNEMIDDYNFIPLQQYDRQEKYVQQKFIDNLFEMSKNKDPDIQCSLSKILSCIIRVITYRKFLYEKNFIHILSNIICNSEDEWAPIHCIYILLNISNDYPDFYSIIIQKKDLLEKLFNYSICITNFQGILRRYSIYIISNLCITKATEIINYFGKDMIISWLFKIDKLIDKYIDVHIENMKYMIKDLLFKNSELKIYKE